MNQLPLRERWIRRTLRAGVWISAGLMLVGVIAGVAVPPSEVSSHVSLGEYLRSFFGGIQLSVGETLLYAGIVILILTPVFRVLSAGITFVLEKDWRFATISALIFFTLIAELVFAVL